MDVEQSLRSHPLFSGMGAEALCRLAALGQPAAYRPGEVVIRAGEAGELFGVLLSGRLTAVLPAGEGARPVGRIDPGECFGEMSLLTGEPSGADVVAEEPSQAVVFAQEAVAPLLAADRQALRYLSRQMSARLSPTRSKQAPPRPAAVRYSLGASGPMRVLSISCRRDDLRYHYYDTSGEAAVAWGEVTHVAGGGGGVHHGGGADRPLRLEAATHAAAVSAALRALTDDPRAALEAGSGLSAVGHRVCHGGARFDGPVVVDDEVAAEIRRLSDLAPMENPYNLAGIEACRALLPDVPQVAVFDTAFHVTMPAAARRLAVPDDLAGEQLRRRYGGHGISHQGAARDACCALGVHFDALKLVCLHLGSGASVTAIDHGRSVENSMGLTPLAGLVMATRCGDVDPGLMLHLLGGGMSAETLARRLYDESGLLGLSGISGDVREVLAAAEGGDGRALEAVQAYCHRARQYLCAYVGLLGGVEAIVFTGGVGQNNPGLRARICQGLEWMGVVLDEARNRAAAVAPGEAREISQDCSRARVLVVGSNEPHTIACQAVRAVAQGAVTEVIRRRRRPIPIGTSAHHVHLTPAHVETLFGPGRQLTWHADLTQPGQYACREQLSLLGPKGRIDRVRVLGPTRDRSQVEISRTEEFKLGIDAPIRLSGDLDGTPGIVLEGPAGRVTLAEGVICAMRHIHMSPEDAMAYAVRDRDVVRVRVPGERELVFGDVVVRVSPEYRLDMHLDTDEANAAELAGDAVGYLDSIQQRA
jgi:acetate kinase